MPIYEFYCSECEETMEILQKVDAQAPPMCERCQAQGSLTKVVSQSAFHLKGGGWYKDAYSSKKPQTTDSPAKKDVSVAPEPKKTPTEKE
jgi:putative FmdB family regulatory protein